MEKVSHKIEYLKFIIGRYDHYLNAVNIKGRFIVALFTFTVTMMLYNATSLLETNFNILWWVFLVLLLVAVGLCFTGIYNVLNAVFPYLNSGNSSKDQYHSLVYFGSVNEFNTQEEYWEKLSARSEKEDLSDLSNQVYILSESLVDKYEAIQSSINFLYSLGGIITLIIILKIVETSL